MCKIIGLVFMFHCNKHHVCMCVRVCACACAHVAGGLSGSDELSLAVSVPLCVGLMATDSDIVWAG